MAVLSRSSYVSGAAALGVASLITLSWSPRPASSGALEAQAALLSGAGPAKEELIVPQVTQPSSEDILRFETFYEDARRLTHAYQISLFSIESRLQQEEIPYLRKIHEKISQTLDLAQEGHQQYLDSGKGQAFVSHCEEAAKLLQDFSCAVEVCKDVEFLILGFQDLCLVIESSPDSAHCKLTQAKISGLYKRFVALEIKLYTEGLGVEETLAAIGTVVQELTALQEEEAKKNKAPKGRR